LLRAKRLLRGNEDTDVRFNGHVYVFTPIAPVETKLAPYFNENGVQYSINDIKNGLIIDVYHGGTAANDSWFFSHPVADIDREQNNGVFYYDEKTGAVKISPEKVGYEVDKALLKSLILDAISVGGGSISIPKCIVAPKLYGTDLVGATYQRGAFTTYYLEQSKERASNIALATATISGTLVLPNEEFSFNKVVGERTEKRGYKIAKVIKGDSFVDGVGGGVCQVSTTLYNAVLLSGLEVKEVHRHTLAVGYVKKSFDAMVSYNFADLKFINTTAKPILIVGWAGGGAVKFAIYGTKSNQKISLESVVTKIV
jgi:vancomycin resistance protein YoaR